MVGGFVADIIIPLIFECYELIRYSAWLEWIIDGCSLFTAVLALDGFFLLTANALLRINNFVEYGGFIRFLFCCVRLYISLGAILWARKKVHKFHSKIVYYSHYYINSEKSDSKFPLPSMETKIHFMEFSLLKCFKNYCNSVLFDNILHGPFGLFN